MSSSDNAICVENLSKRYIISHQRAAGDGLRHVLQDKALAPWRRLQAKLKGRKEKTGTSENPSTLDSSLSTSSAPTEEFWALKDVSFEVKRGEVLGIIGRNGAGKSTLLKILSRITEPTKGRITIEGRVASLLEVGTGFHPELTGRENIFLNGAILGMTRQEIKSKFDEIVAFAEVERFLDTPVKRYSSGMYVRLAFAVSAHLQTDILIVDEVLAVGDAQFQKKCMGKMESVSRQEGRTVLFVSHNMGAAQTLCQRGVLLRNGSVIADSTSEDAVRIYLHSLEVGSSRNLLDIEDRHGKGEVRLTRVDILSGRGEPVEALMTGEPARFVFHVTKIRPRMSINFLLHAPSGAPILFFDSKVASYKDVCNPNLGNSFVCEIAELPLLRGRYRMYANLYIAGEWQDGVDAAAMVEVEEGYFDRRPACSTPWGVFTTHHSWTLPYEAAGG
jgi:lipopolysaccharide transport system ATP-binding protein